MFIKRGRMYYNLNNVIQFTKEVNGLTLFFPIPNIKNKEVNEYENTVFITQDNSSYAQIEDFLINKNKIINLPFND